MDNYLTTNEIALRLKYKKNRKRWGPEGIHYVTLVTQNKPFINTLTTCLTTPPPFGSETEQSHLTQTHQTTVRLLSDAHIPETVAEIRMDIINYLFKFVSDHRTTGKGENLTHSRIHEHYLDSV